MPDINVHDVNVNVSSVNASVVALPCHMPMSLIISSELEWIGQSGFKKQPPDFREKFVQSERLFEFYVHVNSIDVMPPDGRLVISSSDVGCLVFKLSDEYVNSKPADPSIDLQSFVNHRVRPDVYKPPYVLRKKPLPLKLGRARIYRKQRKDKGSNIKDTTQAKQNANQSVNVNVMTMSNDNVNVNDMSKVNIFRQLILCLMMLLLMLMSFVVCTMSMDLLH